jgi:hypothetical protein
MPGGVFGKGAPTLKKNQFPGIAAIEYDAGL